MFVNTSKIFILGDIMAKGRLSDWTKEELVGEFALILHHDIEKAYAYSKVLSVYFTSVDEVEKETGLDFLKELPDTIEKKIEKEKASQSFILNFLN